MVYTINDMMEAKEVLEELTRDLEEKTRVAEETYNRFLDKVTVWEILQAKTIDKYGTDIDGTKLWILTEKTQEGKDAMDLMRIADKMRFVAIVRRDLALTKLKGQIALMGMK
jgi:hypothetical protein